MMEETRNYTKPGPCCERDDACRAAAPRSANLAALQERSNTQLMGAPEHGEWQKRRDAKKRAR
jgi:hypothetical protein